MGWEILTNTQYQQFRKSHVAELEVVRSTLPYWLARGAVDSSGNNETQGYPAAILTNSAAEHYYAFIWYFKRDGQAQLDRLVGFINTSPDIGLRCKSECPTQVTADHELLKDAIILGSDVDWHGPSDPPVQRKHSQPFELAQISPSIEESTEDPPQTDPQASTEATDSSSTNAGSGASTEVVIKTALNEIRKDYKVESDEPSALTVTQRWLRRARNLTIEMDHVERDAVRSRINREVGNFAFPSNDDEHKSAKVLVTAFDVPFYRGYSLYRLTDRRGLRSKSAYMVMKQPLSDQRSISGTVGDSKEAPVCYLTNNGAPILAFNKLLIERNELELTRTTIIDYLIFFCRFIYADLGAFTIIEHDIDFRWLSKTDEHNKKSPRSALRKLLEPVRILTPITPRDGDESWYYCGAFVCYGRHLFYAIFRIFYRLANDTNVVRIGLVELIADAECVEDLPIFPVAFDRETDFVLRTRPQNDS